MKEIPKFEGRPLIEVPETIPRIGYLQGDFGKAFLESYNTVVKEKYNDNGTLKVFEFEDNIVKGSSTYSSVLAADILKSMGASLAKPAVIESARKSNIFDTRGEGYVDYGVVFRSVDSPNEYLAKQLEPQLKKSLNLKKIKDPVVILSGDLELVNDDKAPKGLGFNLKDYAKPFSAPILKKDGNFKETDKNGLPKKLDSDGNRYSYTTDSGLSGLHLYGGLYVNSSYYLLAYSDSDGRVVAVSEENTQIEKYVAEIDEETAKKIEEIQKIRDEAVTKIKNQ